MFASSPIRFMWTSLMSLCLASTSFGGIDPGGGGPGSHPHPAPGHAGGLAPPAQVAGGIISIPFSNGAAIDVLLTGGSDQASIEVVWVFDHTGAIADVIGTGDPDLAKFEVAKLEPRTLAVAGSTPGDAMKPVSALVPAFVALVGIEDDGTPEPAAHSVLEVAPWAGEQSLVPTPDHGGWQTCPVPTPSGASVCSVVTQHLAPDKILIVINLCNADGTPAGTVKIAKCQQPDGTWICCGALPPGQCEPPGWSFAWSLQGSEGLGREHDAGRDVPLIDEALCRLSETTLEQLEDFLAQSGTQFEGFVFNPLP